MENLELIIDELRESHEDIEEMYCKIGEDEYLFIKEECEEWSGNGKYQNRSVVCELTKGLTERLGIYYIQGQSRCGSPFSEYTYEYEGIERVVKVSKTITVETWEVCNG